MRVWKERLRILYSILYSMMLEGVVQGLKMLSVK